MTNVEKLVAKRSATVARIDQLRVDEKRVAEKLAAATALVKELDTRIADAAAFASASPAE